MRRHAALCALGSGILFMCLPGGPAAVGPTSPTRADLDLLRRRAALLESEHALVQSRKPYLVLDLGARTLRYGLLGMTLRELRLDAAEARGLETIKGDGAPAPTSVAAILTLKEKQSDPRLSPLTPAQIEAGATDEDAADVLPPVAPADYLLRFRQPLLLQVEGSPQEKGAFASALSAVGAWWRRLWQAGTHLGRARSNARLTIHLGEEMAREVYRSLVPGERLVVVTPPGLFLPEAGQEPPGSIRPAKPASPPPVPPEAAPGVPFRIPPPVETPSDITPSEAGTPKGDGISPAQPVLPEPAPSGEEEPDPPPEEQEPPAEPPQQ